MIRSYSIMVSLIFLAILLTACCADIQTPASVIAKPLYEAKTPQDRVENLSALFHQEFLDHLNAKEITLTDKFLFIDMDPAAFIRVEIELRKSEDDSAKRYQEECGDIHSYQFPDQFTFVGLPGNQYCISYIKQARSGPESFCKPYGKYYTKAVFQKGQILFIFRESSLDKDNTEINDAIEAFARQLNK